MNDVCGKISEHLDQQRRDHTDVEPLNGRQRRTAGLEKSLAQSNHDNATWREETCVKRSNIVIVELTLVCSADHLLDDGGAIADVASFL